MARGATFISHIFEKARCLILYYGIMRGWERSIPFYFPFGKNQELTLSNKPGLHDSGVAAETSGVHSIGWTLILKIFIRPACQSIPSHSLQNLALLWVSLHHNWPKFSQPLGHSIPSSTQMGSRIG